MHEHILVVDDDELVRTGLAAALKADGYEVVTATCGEDALHMLERQRTDLMLCDMVMEGMSGIEVLHRVRSRWPDVVVIMITGHATISNALEALKMGASDYIQKPASPEEVSHRIRSALEAVHLRTGLAMERQKAEQHKKEVTDHLIRSERMTSIGMLAEGAARDLSHILEPLSDLANDLKRKLGDKLNSVPGVDAIEGIAHKAAAMLRDLQSIGGAKQADKGTVNLRAMIDQCVKSEALVQVQRARPWVRLNIKVGSNLPDLHGNAERLQQVVHNLIANAFDASPQTPCEIRVYATCEHVERAVGRFGFSRPGTYVILHVEDQGPRLSAEDLERMFEPFHAQKKLNRYLVSGLGMTLVHRVVEEHHGFLDIVEAAKGGNAIRAYLPAEVSASDTSAQTRTDFSGKETVLVVDDYQAQRDMAASILRAAGYTIIVAANGREAVRFFEQAKAEGRNVDIAVIDLILGDDFDGVSTYKKLLEISPGQKAVIVSGFADLARIVEARQLGVRHVVQKPYTLETLGRAIRAEMDG